MKTRRQSWWRKEKFKRKDEQIGWPGPQMMLATRLIHKCRIFCFPKDIAVWPKWTRFDLQNRGDFTLQCRQPYAPKAPVTNTCHWSNQEKITNEFSWTIALVFAISEETEEQLAVTSR